VCDSHDQLTPWRQNPKVYHRVYKIPPPVPVLSQLDPLYTPPASQSPQDPFWSHPPIYACLPNGLSSSGFPAKTLYTSLSFHASHMPRPPHSPWFHLPNDIWGWVRIMKLFTVQLSPVSSSLLGPDILLRTLFSNILSQCSSLNVRDQVSHPYKTSGRIMDSHDQAALCHCLSLSLLSLGASYLTRHLAGLVNNWLWYAFTGENNREIKLIINILYCHISICRKASVTVSSVQQYTAKSIQELLQPFAGQNGFCKFNLNC
jgi:hypothetical protein